MDWQLRIAKKVQKSLAKLPSKDTRLILASLEEIHTNPFSGDLKRLQGYPMSWRRRVGNYRIFFEIHEDIKIISVFEIARRTSKTY